MVHCRFPDRLNEKTIVEIKVQGKSEDKLSLALISLNSSKLMFTVHQLSILECLLVNLTSKTMYVKFEKLNSEGAPVNIHKIIVEEEVGSGGFEIKEESSLPLKIVFFPRMAGTYSFDFFKVHSIVNKMTTLVEFQTQDIIVN